MLTVPSETVSRENSGVSVQPSSPRHCLYQQGLGGLDGLSFLYPRGQPDQKQVPRGSAAPRERAPFGCCPPSPGQSPVVSRFLTAFSSCRFHQVPPGAFLEGRASCLCQVSMSLLSWHLWRQHLPILYSAPDMKLPRLRVKSHRKTGPCPGGTYEFCVAQREPVEDGGYSPFLYHLLLSRYVFKQNLTNKKSSVYLDELITWSAACPLGPVSHTS